MESVRINDVCNLYCGNEMRKLVQMCYPIMIKIGGISECDYDDFYSIANAVVWTAAKSFDEEQNDNFDAFLRNCIERKFRTEMTRRNRDRRVPTSMTDRLDKPMSNDSTVTFGETLKSNFNLDEEIDCLMEEDSVLNYFKRLSPKQKEIATLAMDGYELHEIKEILGIPDKRFAYLLADMRTFDKRMTLKRKH